MELSSFIRVGQYKSPLRVVAGILLRSRETQAKRARQKSEEIERFRQFIQQQQRDLDKAHEERAEMKLRIAQLRIENDRLREQPPVLPHDPVLTNHEFGLKMISVCVNLAMKVGLRASIMCLEILMDWKTEDMAAAYERLADKMGNPLAVLTDGASESSRIDCPPNHPDIIMLGEIRDEETAVMAIQSSHTGHVVLSTSIQR